MLRKSVVLLAFPLIATMACGRSPESQMLGTYVREGETSGTGDTEALEIAADRIMISNGPLSITASYDIAGVEGSEVTLTLSYSQEGGDGTAVVSVQDELLVIDDGNLFSGRWQRRPR